MKLSLLPIKYKDHRTYDWHRTFGVATFLPREFNFNTLKLYPNQNTDGLPEACTSYAQNGIASNEDHVVYDDYDYTYRNTLKVMGAPYGEPCDIMTSLDACTTYGVKSKAMDAADALAHRRAPYFIIRRTTDYFDGLLSALWIKQGGISIGTPWLPWFENVGPDGVIPPVFIDPKMKFVEGHDWIAYGVKVVDGEQRIVCVSHQGGVYGNGGECYFTRVQINTLLGIKGSGAFGQKHAEPGDIQRVKMTILTVWLSYLYQWSEILARQFGRLMGFSAI